MKRWSIVFLAVILFLSMVMLGGYHLGVRLLHEKIAAALGPGASIGEVKVNWFSLDILRVSIEAPKGWPTARALRAERITIIPSLRSLLTDQIHVASITFEKPYLSVVRTRGKWRLLPGLMEAPNASKTNAGKERGRLASPAVIISKVFLQEGVLELFDMTVNRAPFKTRLERLNGVIHDIEAPWRKTKTRFELSASVKGVRRDGRAQLAGWVGPGQQDSSSQIALGGVDLVSLQPYLVRIGEAQVSKGSLDLRLNSEVRAKRLDGKGKMIIRDLEFAPSRGYLETFMGVPRSALINFLKNNDNAIDVDFVLTGDTANPSFSINEAITTRVAMGMAAELGVSIRSLAQDFGNLGRRGVEGAAGVAEGVSAVIKSLFGGTNN